MKKIPPTLQKFLYGFAFLVLVPLGLVFWAGITESHVRYPGLKSEGAGILLLLSGGLLMLWSMGSLMTKGGGLPMNAFPPRNFVETGPYGLFRHPIYLGFGAMVAGYFLYTGSASGFWLVTPLTILGMAALVLGFEGPDLKQRFPGKTLSPLFGLPEADNHVPGPYKRFFSLGSILVLTMALNFLLANTARIFPLEELTSLFSTGGDRGPWLYLNLIPLLAVPFVLKRNTDLRSWTLWSATALGAGFLWNLVGGELCGAAWMFPGRHFLSVPLYIVLIALFTPFRNYRSAYLITGVAFLPFLALQVLFQDNFVNSLILSVLLFLAVVNASVLWGWIRRLSERLANSWKEWVLGRVRVINHGFYVGGGGLLGILIAGNLAGAAYAWALLAFAVTVVLFSAIWAQVIEGSEKLKRPFGFYGALVGILFAGLLVWAMGFNPWVLIGVISVMMPWVQAIGRLRCLINGCCHGMRTNNPEVGIRYFHPRSRVCNISDMKGEWLHPTPLYSILWLLPVGFILLALWHGGAAPNFIFGLYLILTGIGRFVEEAYRGEVQTPILGKLRLYQWTAALSVLVGILFTMLQVQTPALSPGFSIEVLLAALSGGLFVFFAMGVDFPYSNKRFSRLV
ncbi:MAG: prolipoprotein diacylglyceryl transferase family protein [Robiginitalea sp.]